MEGMSGKSGLVLAGGGARAAYQVGVLRALKEMLPDPTVNPFPIICRTSAIACSGYTSGQSCSFFEAADHFEPWQRSQRIGIKTRISVEHLMASSAIPFLFAPYKLNREFFGDGSMRQIAPVSPALHLGADRVIVVGTARIRNDAPERTRGDLYPTLAQVAGHVMNSIFLDSLAVDLERLERINKTISAVPAETLKKMGLTLHHVDVLVLPPPAPLPPLAVNHARH